MSTPFAGERDHGRRHHGHESDGPGFGLWDTFESLRTDFERRGAPRRGRGDVRAAILMLLTEESMHGYQIIREIEKRSDGAWKPSPGSVYPTLQLLADEGLIYAQEADGKKTYSLTEKGTDEVETSRPAPWETLRSRDSARSGLLTKSAAKLGEAVILILRGGVPTQVHEAATVIDEARNKLYTILAEK